MSGGWERVWTLFEEAVELPTEERPAFLEGVCGDDAMLRRAVEELLEADGEGDSLLDCPVLPPRGSRPGDEPRKAVGHPTSFGPYRLQRKIGEGGMSAVYLAVRDDDAYRRRVVVKLVRRGMEREAVLRRLRTERQILAGLDHPNIARLYDGGSTPEGLPYFVMEHVDGVPIDRYCKHNELPVAERLRLFRKVCAAVQYAHQNLVVHRDLKPSNILVTADGEPKLLDFGIAKLLNPELAATELEPTVTATRMLTPSYASPEQIRGETITTASDVYSLGVLLYELLAGRLPYDFAGHSPAEIERLVTEGEPRRPSDAATDPASSSLDPLRLQRLLAGDLDAIVLKAMRPAPPSRYGSVEQLATDVDRYLSGLPVEARRGSWRYRAGKFIHRHRTGVLVGLLIAVLVVNFGAALARQSVRIREERDQARFERDKTQRIVSLFQTIIAFAEPYVAPGEELSMREAVERSTPLLAERLADEPDVRAQLLHTTGSMLTRLGAFQSAREQLEEALAIRRELNGDGSVETAEGMTALAAVLKVYGEHDAAEDLARRAFSALKSQLPAGDLRVVASLNELVSVLCYREEFAAAEPLAAEAVELSRSYSGDHREQRMVALAALARVRIKLGDYREAASLQRRSLALRRELYGEGHPSLAVGLHNLGMALRWLDELEGAERTYRESLELTRATYGDRHPEFVGTLNNLAGVRFARGDYSGAFEDHRQAYEITLETLGPEHWRAFFFGVRMEASRLRAGDPKTAEDNLRRQLATWSGRLGDGHWLPAFAACILGEAIAAQGRLEEAEPHLLGGFLRLVEVGAKHRYRAQALERLTHLLEGLGRQHEVAHFASMIAPVPGA